MKLQDPRQELYEKKGYWGRVAIDALLKQAARLKPNEVAIHVSPDFHGNPQFPFSNRLTWREVNQSVDKIALALYDKGLRPGQTVAIYLPGTLVSLVSFLACIRIGVIPAIVPITWREKELKRALDPLCPRMIITESEKSRTNFAEIARNAAAEIFSVRSIMAFGSDLPDGVTSIHAHIRVLEGQEMLLPTIKQETDRIVHISFSTRPYGGFQHLYRHSGHFVSGGLYHIMNAKQARRAPDTFTTFLAPLSLQALDSIIMPWLMLRGQLNLLESANIESVLDYLDIAVDFESQNNSKIIRGEENILLPSEFYSALMPLLSPQLSKSMFWSWSTIQSFYEHVNKDDVLEGSHIINLENFACVSTQLTRDIYLTLKDDENDIQIAPQLMPSAKNVSLQESALLLTGPSVASRSPNEKEVLKQIPVCVSSILTSKGAKIVNAALNRDIIAIGSYRLSVHDLESIVRRCPYVEKIYQTDDNNMAPTLLPTAKLNVVVKSGAHDLQDAITDIKAHLDSAHLSPLIKYISFEIEPATVRGTQRRSA